MIDACKEIPNLSDAMQRENSDVCKLSLLMLFTTWILHWTIGAIFTKESGLGLSLQSGSDQHNFKPKLGSYFTSHRI